MQRRVEHHPAYQLFIIIVPEQKEGEKGSERICEKMISKNFQNLMKNYNSYIQEPQQIPCRIN